jgi:hypothetical protein
VPTAAIDIAYGPDGALVVLSQTGDLGYWSGNSSVVVTRVEPAPEGSQGVIEDTVTVIAELPRQAALGRFVRTAAGALSFLTLQFPEALGPIVAVLNTTDGQALDQGRSTGALGEVDAHGTNGWGRADLSPDAARMFVTERAQTYSVDVDPSNPEPDEFPYRGRRYWDEGGVDWLPGAVAIWDYFDIDVYDDTPPHALRWEYHVEALPGADVGSHFLGATAVGDKLVVTTNTGIRILGADGALVGGSDPFPCGMTTTAVAERTGPTTVAVGAGGSSGGLLYVFDVAF